MNFNSWSFFRCFFWSVNCTSQVFISQHFLDMDNIFSVGIQELQYETLVLLAIFFDLEMTQFWSVNYIRQVCKSKLLFSLNSKFWTIFMLIGSYFWLFLNIFITDLQQLYSEMYFLYFLETVETFFF